MPLSGRQGNMRYQRIIVQSGSNAGGDVASSVPSGNSRAVIPGVGTWMSSDFLPFSREKIPPRYSSGIAMRVVNSSKGSLSNCWSRDGSVSVCRKTSASTLERFSSFHSGKAREDTSGICSVDSIHCILARQWYILVASAATCYEMKPFNDCEDAPTGSVAYLLLHALDVATSLWAADRRARSNDLNASS